jgi:hypothetical protein
MKRPLSGPAPRLKAPTGACDTHVHFYAAKISEAPAPLMLQLPPTGR